MTDEEFKEKTQINFCGLLVLVTMTLILTLVALYNCSNSRDRISALEKAATTKETK